MRTRVGQPGSESWAANNTEATWAVLDVLTAVTAPIIGARSVEQLDDNLGAAGWELDPAQLARLDETSAVPTPYPYDFIANAAKRR